MDQLQTVPLEYVEGPQMCRSDGKRGDIPNPSDPPEAVFDYVIDRLWRNPPRAWDPHLQHKRPFRELCAKGGQAHGLNTYALVWDVLFTSIYNECICMQDLMHWAVSRPAG